MGGKDNREEEIKKLFSEGRKYFNNGEYQKAIEYYNKILELDVNYSDAYNNRGLAYDNLGEHLKAIEDHNKSIELDPNASDAYYNRGITYANLGKNLKAIEDYTEAIRIDPNDSDAYNNSGLTYFEQSKYEEAIKNIAELINNCSDILYKLYFLLKQIYLNVEKEEINRIKEIIKSIINKQEKVKIKQKINEAEYEEITSLYSYVPFDKNTIDSIIHEYKYASTIFSFNDPADPVIRLTKDFKNTKEMFDKVRIACFSTDPFNMLMHSHYADSHKGICIEYDFSNFNIENTSLVKVEYEKELIINESILTVTISSDNKIKTNETSFINLFNTKHKNWEYEAEYRIISYDVEKITLPIKAIYYGKEMSDEDIELIKKIVKDKNTLEFKKIDLYRIETKEGNLFKLEANKIIEERKISSD